MTLFLYVVHSDSNFIGPAFPSPPRYCIARNLDRFVRRLKRVYLAGAVHAEIARPPAKHALHDKRTQNELTARVPNIVALLEPARHSLELDKYRFHKVPKLGEENKRTRHILCHASGFGESTITRAPLFRLAARDRNRRAGVSNLGANHTRRIRAGARIGDRAAEQRQRPAETRPQPQAPRARELRPIAF